MSVVDDDSAVHDKEDAARCCDRQAYVQPSCLDSQGENGNVHASRLARGGWEGDSLGPGRFASLTASRGTSRVRRRRRVLPVGHDASRERPLPRERCLAPQRMEELIEVRCVQRPPTRSCVTQVQSPRLRYAGAASDWASDSGHHTSVVPNAQKATASSNTPDQDGAIDTMHHNPNRRAAYTVFFISFADRVVIAPNRTPLVCQIPTHCPTSTRTCALLFQAGREPPR